MNSKDIYVTISHLADFCSYNHLRVDDRLILRKDKDNIYDDEAIAVYDTNRLKIGYVANSVHSVARGTYSAGRIYDLMADEEDCRVRFIFDDKALVSMDHEKNS